MARPNMQLTILTLTAGTLVAVAIFVASFVARLTADSALADVLGGAAVVALLITPAAGLVATAAELRVDQRTAALSALAVLTVLAVATVLALFAR